MSIRSKTGKKYDESVEINTKEKKKRETVPITVRYQMVDGSDPPKGNRGNGESDPPLPPDPNYHPDTMGPPGSGSTDLRRVGELVSWRP